MAIGITPEHVDLGGSMQSWAHDLGALDAVRAAETEPSADFAEAWQAVSEMGLATIAVAETYGGGGGTLLDQAVALSACAHAVVPGPLFGTVVASQLVVGESLTALTDGAAAGVALEASLRIEGDRLRGSAMVTDAAGVSYLLLGAADETGAERWFWLSDQQVTLTPAAGLDLTRRPGNVSVDLPLGEASAVTGLTTADVRRTASVLAAAEAAGIARWALETAVDYAKVREQFGVKIGSFQAIKHLCAEMLETVESIDAVAWDAASVSPEDQEQADFAAAVAAAVALDGAVRVAQDCIQVLGGIGFTFEHDAHFYLRRAVALRTLLGSGDRHALGLADAARRGIRRRAAVDLDGADEAIRPRIREQVAAIATAQDPARALADSGMLMPHWPEPHGLGADPVTQLVIDQELAAAGIVRPDLKIGAWAIPTILAHGTEEQKAQFVGPTLHEDLIWCQLFSEPGAGSDLASLRTRAVKVDGGWKLSGQKVWNSLAREAHWGICLARTDAEVPQHKGISYFLVDMSSPGIDTRPLREMTGDELFNEVFLDDVFVPDDMMVGEPGDGWKLTRTTLANERVAMAGSKLGVSTEGCIAALDDGSDVADRARVGHQVALATVCALLGLRTTLKALAGQGPGAESSVAKLLGVRNRQDASELLVDLLGSPALLSGPEVSAAVHEMLLTRCLSIAGGTTQILRNVAAERILGLPR